MEMLDGKRRTRGLMGVGIDSAVPQARIAVAFGSEVQSASIRRPGGPIFNTFVGYRNPGVFVNWLRLIDGGDGNSPPIWLNSRRKTNPVLIGREMCIQQMIAGMLQ